MCNWNLKNLNYSFLLMSALLIGFTSCLVSQNRSNDFKAKVKKWVQKEDLQSLESFYLDYKYNRSNREASVDNYYSMVEQVLNSHSSYLLKNIDKYTQYNTLWLNTRLIENLGSKQLRFAFSNFPESYLIECLAGLFLNKVKIGKDNLVSIIRAAGNSYSISEAQFAIAFLKKKFPLRVAGKASGWDLGPSLRIETCQNILEFARVFVWSYENYPDLYNSYSDIYSYCSRILDYDNKINPPYNENEITIKDLAAAQIWATNPRGTMHNRIEGKKTLEYYFQGKMQLDKSRNHYRRELEGLIPQLEDMLSKYPNI